MRNEFNLIDSKASLISRVGTVGSNHFDAYTPAVEYFNKRIGKKNQYDLSYLGTKDEFIHTPIFNDMLYLKTASDSFNTHLIKSIETTNREVELSLKPKYLQVAWDRPIDEMIVLPGSNLMNRLDGDFLDALSSRGAYFKLHPVTCRLDKFTVMTRRKAIEDFYSGIDVIRCSKTVWAADCSELGLIAKYLGKEVKRAYLKGYRGTYVALYNNMDSMSTWLNAAESGVVRMTHYKEDIDAYIEHYRRHYDDLCSVY